MLNTLNALAAFGGVSAIVWFAKLGLALLDIRKQRGMQRALDAAAEQAKDDELEALRKGYADLMERLTQARLPAPGAPDCQQAAS